MFDGGSKWILGEVYSSNVGVIGQGINNGLDSSRSGGRCLTSRRHEEDACSSSGVQR